MTSHHFNWARWIRAAVAAAAAAAAAAWIHGTLAIMASSVTKIKIRVVKLSYYDSQVTNWHLSLKKARLRKQKKKMVITEFYYMPTIVSAFWLAAGWARFSFNDRALRKFFSARRVFWVVSKSNDRVGENNIWTRDDWKRNLEWPFYNRNSRALIG